MYVHAAKPSGCIWNPRVLAAPYLPFDKYMPRIYDHLPLLPVSFHAKGLKRGLRDIRICCTAYYCPLSYPLSATRNSPDNTILFSVFLDAISLWYQCAVFLTEYPRVALLLAAVHDGILMVLPTSKTLHLTRGLILARMPFYQYYGFLD